MHHQVKHPSQLKLKISLIIEKPLIFLANQPIHDGSFNYFYDMMEYSFLR